MAWAEDADLEPKPLALRGVRADRLVRLLQVRVDADGAPPGAVVLDLCDERASRVSGRSKDGVENGHCAAGAWG